MMVVPVDRPDPAAAMWENLPVDTELGPLETTISDHDVKCYGYAVDDFHPWYMDHSPFGGRVVPPALLSVALFKLRHLPGNFALMHGLHTREELQLFRAVRLGEPVTLRARVTDKFTKRGERFIVVSGQVSDDRDRPILRTRQTQLLRKNVERIVGRRTARPTEHVVNGAIADGARLAAACPSAEIGAILPALTKHVTFEQMTVFSFGPRTIQTDREFAIESGLAGPIAQGLMSTCYLSEMLVNFFGATWFDSGWTSHAFIKPVASGDRGQCRRAGELRTPLQCPQRGVARHQAVGRWTGKQTSARQEPEPLRATTDITPEWPSDAGSCARSVAREVAVSTTQDIDGPYVPDGIPDGADAWSAGKIQLDPLDINDSSGCLTPGWS